MEVANKTESDKSLFTHLTAMPIIEVKAQEPEPPRTFMNTSYQLQVLEPVMATLEDRTDCEDIRGKPYRSMTEREWFLANCIITETPVVEEFQYQAVEAENPPAIVEPPTVSVGGVQADFIAGARAAGASEAVIAHLLYIVPCESGWDPYAYNPAGPFYGLLQFLESTWYGVGGGDIYSAWQQGYNGAVNYMISGPVGQWPVCQL